MFDGQNPRELRNQRLDVRWGARMRNRAETELMGGKTGICDPCDIYILK